MILNQNYDDSYFKRFDKKRDKKYGTKYIYLPYDKLDSTTDNFISFKLSTTRGNKYRCKLFQY